MPVSAATRVESLVKPPLRVAVACSLTLSTEDENVGASLTGVTFNVAVLLVPLKGDVAVSDVVLPVPPATPELASHAV